MLELAANFTLGLGFLIWGMRLLKSGLENAAGQRFKLVIQKLTTNPVNGMLTGTAITALIQSSTAVSVFSISLVNAKLMTFEQALGVILGTNIGSTVTAQLMAFDFQRLALPAVALGGVLFVLGSHGWRWFGLSMIGFGLVFMGIGVMANALEPLSSSTRFTTFLNTLGNNRLYGVCAGAILAGLIHSSGVTTGMVIVLASQDLITLPTAIAVVLGANVGTCFTAVLAAIGGDTGAKRVAVSHVLLNVFGVLAFLPLLTPFARIISSLSTDLGRQVAHAHTFFNIASSLAVLPVIKPFTKLVCILVPDRPPA